MCLRMLKRIFGARPGRPAHQNVIMVCRSCGSVDHVYSGPPDAFDVYAHVDDDDRYQCQACKDGRRHG